MSSQGTEHKPPYDRNPDSNFVCIHLLNNSPTEYSSSQTVQPQTTAPQPAPRRVHRYRAKLTHKLASPERLTKANRRARPKPANLPSATSLCPFPNNHAVKYGSTSLAHSSP